METPLFVDTACQKNDQSWQWVKHICTNVVMLSLSHFAGKPCYGVHETTPGNTLRNETSLGSLSPPIRVIVRCGFFSVFLMFFLFWAWEWQIHCQGAVIPLWVWWN